MNTYDRIPARRIARIAVRVALIGLRLAVLGGVLGVAAFVGLLAYYGRDLPSIDGLRDRQPFQTTRVLARGGETLGEIFTERRTVIPASEIPNVMVISVLAAEDANFYAHRGLDYRGIARAILRDLARGRAAQGASTITQQVVKVVLLSPERTLARKVRELLLARRIEQELSKEEILALYLNTINFGDGRYGVEEASLYYFGKHARELTLAEAALLAGLPQSPTRLNPYRNLDAALRRQRYVLGQLDAKLDTHFRNHLTREEILRARDTPIRLARAAAPATHASPAPEILELVKRELRGLVGDEAYRRGGFRVETTIDLALQQRARAALRDQLARIDQRQGHLAPLAPPRPGRRVSPMPRVDALRTGRSYAATVVGADDATGRIELDVGGIRAHARVRDHARFNPRGLGARAFAADGARVLVSLDQAATDTDTARVHLELGPEGAVVVLDPRTREVVAMVGGASEYVGFNRAVQARRQPGSTFKAVVYSAAVRSRRFTAASIVTPEDVAADSTLTRVPDADELVTPIRLRAALAQSINPVAVHLFLALGAGAVIAEARALGIESPLDPNPALALGASEVTPIEMTNAYATLASGGRFAPTRLIRRIVDASGREVRLPPRAAERQAMTPEEAFLITSMLRSVVEEGTAQTAKSLGRPLAGKTGTTNEARDTWFIGFTPRTVVGVWVGFDDRRPMGRGEEGSRSALPVFVDTLRAAEGPRSSVGFPLPAGIALARIDPITGLLATPETPGAIEESFLLGTVPIEYAPPPDAGVPPDLGVDPAAIKPPSELVQAPSEVPVMPEPPPPPPSQN